MLETLESSPMRARVARALNEDDFQPASPPGIPDYTLLHRIGKGAFGEVWLARSALGALRAAKIVYRARFKDDRPYEREFQGILKYEPLSRSHDGLVQILHAGRNDETGCFYYVMELADPTGNEIYAPRTLQTDLARRGRLSPEESARIVLRLADALGHLHERGLVHRDIKPGNVIFVSGQPKLADIGLVTDIGSAQSFVGTDGFIPPEGPGTPRADIYALGKVLYELATGRDRMDFPQLPAELNDVAGCSELLELNEIITRACAPNPSKRYATVTELQADLNLFLAGRSLRRARDLERYLARARQLAGALAIVLAITAAALWLARRDERHARERAALEATNRAQENNLRLRAEAAERSAQMQLHTALLEQARATVRSREQGHRVRTLEAITRAASISNSVELRREVFAALALPDLRPERTINLDGEHSICWLDPQFERIALCRGRGAVEIRRLADNQLLATLPASTNLMAYSAIWSRDARFLMIKRDYDDTPTRGDLEVWNVAEQRQVFLLRDVSRTARAFHPRKPHLAVARYNGEALVLDLETGREILQRRFPDTVFDRFAYSPDAERMAATYWGGDAWKLSVSEVENSVELASHGFPDYLSALEWHPGGRWLALADYGGNVHLLDSRSGKLRTLGRHKVEAATLSFSPDGGYLFSGGWERELICWDMRTFQRVCEVGLDSYVMQFRADGLACALISPRGVQLHKFERPVAHRELTDDLGPRLVNAAFSPDGRWLAASADKRFAVWDLKTESPALLDERGFAMQLYWSGDSREIFGTRRMDQCLRWEIDESGRSVRRIPFSKPEQFVSLAVATDLAAWTTSQGSQVIPLDGPIDGRWKPTPPGVNEVSPDGKWLAIYRPYSAFLYLYELPSLAPVATLTNLAKIGAVAFSPTGDEVAVASGGQVEFWSTADWQRTRILRNVALPTRLIYQPDGRAFWLGTDARTGGLYDAATLEPILILPCGMIPLALSADGRQLAVSDGQQLHVWNIAEVRRELRAMNLDWQ